MKIMFLLLTILFSAFSHANEIITIKSELIQEVKVLLKANQNIYPLQTEDKVSMSIFQLISEAYADTEFQCLYGGWPSNLTTVNGKKYCQDAKKSGYYQHSYACNANEMTCPEVLFGKEVCAPYAKQVDRINAYSNCEKREKKIDFTQSFSGRDHQMILEYIKISKDICENKDPKKVISKINCPKIQLKTKEYEKIMLKNAKRDPSAVIPTQPIQDECTNCQNELPGLPTVEEIAKLDHRMQYELLKKNYRESPLCNPKNNYLPEDGVDHALIGIGEVMNSCSSFGKIPEVFAQECTSTVNQLAEDFSLDSPTREKWNEYLKINLAGDNTGMYRIMLHAKKLALNAKEELRDKYAKHTYKKYNILAEEDGELTCPFPSYDVFNKALTGHKKLKSKLKKNTLSIVDYTMPSSQRRMFSFDMNKYSIMHNTWVSHGAGVDMVAADENGANPQISNTQDTNLSSDGFILTSNVSRGPKVGDSIILKGIDKNNENIQKREILLHGDEMINGGYKLLNLQKEEKEARKNSLKEVDVDSDDLYSVRYSANAPGYPPNLLGESWGCLGVPDYPALDLKTNRHTSQLQSLRRDLAGQSLIFSYSGPNMESNYFE